MSRRTHSACCSLPPLAPYSDSDIGRAVHDHLLRTTQSVGPLMGLKRSVSCDTNLRGHPKARQPVSQHYTVPSANSLTPSGPVGFLMQSPRTKQTCRSSLDSRAYGEP